MLPSLHQPKNLDVKLWRYMDLSKFLDLIITESLYFCRADCFEDPYEGKLPMLDIDKVSPQALDLFNASIKDFYISCWHANNHESAAMWKLYSQSNDAIAIETSYETLKELLPNNIALTLVKYEDYNSFSLIEKSFELNNRYNVYDTVTYKRASFEHEKEVRAIVWRHLTSTSSEEKGLKIHINIRKLIHKIHVSPHASSRLYNIINDIKSKYQLDEITIQKSKLYSIN